uniref:Transmembrane protein n=1 Tax=Mycena chlorophos TaxID=658473 RepID=A0ABQ0KXG3_MYCCL|nr:predicted protein [Mycena chlorophos]
MAGDPESRIGGEEDERRGLPFSFSFHWAGLVSPEVSGFWLCLFSSAGLSFFSFSQAAAAWLDSTACRASPTCVVPPKNVKLVDGTWHESSFSLSSGGFPNIPSTATIVFNGSAVYVNSIILGTASNTSANIDLVFFLDGVQVGGFSQSTGTSRNFQSTTVLALENIAARTHTLAIQNGQLDGPDSLLILDSIVYTTVDNPNIAASSSSGVSGTTIAVAAVLVVFVLILLCILAYVLIRRRRRKHRKMYNPYMPKGAIKAFPKDLEPSPASTPTASPRFLPSPIYTGAVAMPPPIYNGNTAGNWWVGRDQKRHFATTAKMGTPVPNPVLITLLLQTSE